MSALRLKYPLKPHAVSDDMESFIYVITYMAFRFHRHDESPPDAPELKDYDSQVSANIDNETFAKLVDTFFYEDKMTKTGLYVGGGRKWVQIKAGVPPLILTTENTTLLSEFLDKAYVLLRQHYLSVDPEEMKRYAIKDCASTSSTPQSASPAPSHSAGPRDNGVDVVRGMVDLPEAEDVPAPSPYPDPPNIKPMPVLQDHHALFNLFLSLFYQNGKTREILSRVDQKLFDQFDGLKAFIAVTIKNSTGLTNSSRSARKAGVNASLPEQPKNAPPDISAQAAIVLPPSPLVALSPNVRESLAQVAIQGTKRKRSTKARPVRQPVKKVRHHGVKMTFDSTRDDGEEDPGPPELPQPARPQTRYALRSRTRK